MSSSTHDKMKLASFILVALTGSALLIWITRHNSLPDESPSDFADQNALFIAATSNFDLAPGPEGGGAVGELIGAIAATKLQSHLSEIQAVRLKDWLGRRYKLLMNPSLTEWLDQVAVDGGIVPLLEGKSEPDDKFKRMWEQASDGLRNTAIARNDISVRLVDMRLSKAIKSGENNRLIHGSGLIRPSQEAASAVYPNPDLLDPSLIGMEIRIPVYFKYGSETDDYLKAISVLTCYWTDSTAHWRPYDFVLYFDSSFFGKTLKFPVF